MKRKQSNAPINTPCVITQGTPRHVEMTHGSHNGRWRSFPHRCDALERPPRLPDLSPSILRDRKPGRRHSRARQPMRRISKFHYQDAAKDIKPSLSTYLVTGNCYDDMEPVSIKLGAASPENACDLALAILRRSYRTYIVNLSASEV